jgi:integrase/recombinase XerD
LPIRLSTTLTKIQSAANTVNGSLLLELYDYMKHNSSSDSHINNTLKTNSLFAQFLGPDVSFYDVNKKNQITLFLDTKMKSVEEDPDKRWITTWNDYLGDIKFFFRWLHNWKLKDTESENETQISEWETPSFAQIKKKKTKRLSPYLESEIWDRDELSLIIKYEQFKRNKAALALMWDLDARNHEITLLKIKSIRLKEKYGEGEIPHEAKTGSGPILLTFSFPYVRDWINEHPFRNEPEARLICNLYNGSPIKPEALWLMMKQLKMRIRRLMENGDIKDEEKEKLELILRSKKFNPYCLRHSSISYDSDYLPEYALKKKCRWTMNSRQGNRYIKSRMGNDLKQKILIQNGILPPEELKGKPSVLNCARCSLVNAIENKYCQKCSYPLTPSAFDEIKMEEDKKFTSLNEKYENDIKELREQMNHIVSLIQENPKLARLKPEVLSEI